MTAYARDIVGFLGCTQADAAMIEYIMREEIFHSTLDWQTKAQFNRAASQAMKLLAADRATYEELFAASHAAYLRMKAEADVREKMTCHEI